MKQFKQFVCHIEDNDNWMINLLDTLGNETLNKKVDCFTSKVSKDSLTEETSS